MKSDIYLSEIVSRRGSDAAVIDVLAAADGRFDRASSRLEVRQDAYLQNFAGEQFRPAWLPNGGTVSEHVPHEEIHEVGRDIFHRWVRKVRESVPLDIPLDTHGNPI